MIRITRLDQPRREPSRRRRRKNKFRYNEDIIVKALWKMQHGKCCYCEMPIPDEGHLKAVEHFRPKSIFKSLTNDWGNLLLACPQCNGKKSNKFPLALSNKVEEAKVLHTKYDALKNRKVRTLLIDPTKVDPEEHLDFKCRDPLEDDFGLICPKKASKYGKHTIKVVGLYDGFYLRRHRTYLRKTLLPAYFRMSEAADHDDQNTLDSHKRDFEAYMSASSEWSGLARAFARQYGLDKYDIIPNVIKLCAQCISLGTRI